MSLTEFYLWEVRRLNWTLHGSGFAGVNRMPTTALELVCGLGYTWSANLAILICYMTLLDSGFANVFEGMGRERQEVKAMLVAPFRSAGS
jgi:hypothetical protein